METNRPRYPLTLYYDGSCPVCASEIQNLAARDAAGRLVMVDCSAGDFDTTGFPVTREEMMGAMHAQDAAGCWMSGVDVFIAAYGAVGMGWVSAFLSHPVVRPLADRGYPWIAQNRYRLSALGFGQLFQLFTQRAHSRRAREAWARSQACQNGACKLREE